MPEKTLPSARARLLARGAAELAAARLARGPSSPVLPDPGPLPESVPVPAAEPPGEMELAGLP